MALECSHAVSRIDKLCYIGCPSCWQGYCRGMGAAFPLESLVYTVSVGD